MRQRLLVVDVDTRSPTGDNQILNPDRKINWHDLEMKGPGFVSQAISNHYLYAMVHGYDYKYYQAQEMPEHFATWIFPTTTLLLPWMPMRLSHILRFRLNGCSIDGESYVPPIYKLHVRAYADTTP
jgi:hypothetical protein